MLTGDLAGTPFLARVRDLRCRTDERWSGAGPEAVSLWLGERAGLVGAGAPVVEHLYPPDRAAERLAALGA
ncbi:hypothetical protein ACGFSB_02660 [Streptomyces sp. NPDC048441]|uniref:hypothetical protein n=1 Tax=Streptomyces sp. NPDC048441 TaxID=3365552 RepID=UPI003713298F